MDDTNKVGCQEVVRTAVSHDGMVLVFAPEEMRNNVTLACNVNPGGVGAKKDIKRCLWCHFRIFDAFVFS